MPKTNEGLCYLYILVLDSGELYVGKTQNYVQRMAQHMVGLGAVATKISAPVACLGVCVYESGEASVIAVTLLIDASKSPCRVPPPSQLQ